LVTSTIAHSSDSRFSIGVPVIAMRTRAVERARGAGALRRRVLDLLGLVEHDHVPVDVLEHADVAAQQRVGGDGDVPGPERPAGDGPLGPVVADHRHVGARSAQLALPVADDRGRADHEVGPVLLPGGQQRDRHDGLAEAHLVGEDPPMPSSASRCSQATPRSW
jgi:hypothetical protein